MSMISETSPTSHKQSTRTATSHRGRPPGGGPAVVVSIDGEGIAWVDGIFAGTDHNLVREAELNARLRLQVQLHPMSNEVVLSDGITPTGAAASMLALSPRALLTHAPAEVWSHFPTSAQTDINFASDERDA